MCLSNDFINVLALAMALLAMQWTNLTSLKSQMCDIVVVNQQRNHSGTYACFVSSRSYMEINRFDFGCFKDVKFVHCMASNAIAKAKTLIKSYERHMR